MIHKEIYLKSESFLRNPGLEMEPSCRCDQTVRRWQRLTFPFPFVHHQSWIIIPAILRRHKTFLLSDGDKFLMAVWRRPLVKYRLKGQRFHKDNYRHHPRFPLISLWKNKGRLTVYWLKMSRNWFRDDWKDVHQQPLRKVNTLQELTSQSFSCLFSGHRNYIWWR